MSTASEEPLPTFLDRLAATECDMDEAQRQIVRQALQARPEVACALVRETLRLQRELADTRHLVARLKRMQPSASRKDSRAGDLHRPPQPQALARERLGGR